MLLFSVEGLLVVVEAINRRAGSVPCLVLLFGELWLLRTQIIHIFIKEAGLIVSEQEVSGIKRANRWLIAHYSFSITADIYQAGAITHHRQATLSWQVRPAAVSSHLLDRGQLFALDRLGQYVGCVIDLVWTRRLGFDPTL